MGSGSSLKMFLNFCYICICAPNSQLKFILSTRGPGNYKGANIGTGVWD